MRVILKTMKGVGHSPESHDDCRCNTVHFSCLHVHSSFQRLSYLLGLFPAFLVSQNSTVVLSFLPAKLCQLNSSPDTLSSYLLFSFFPEFAGKNFYSNAMSACIHRNNSLIKLRDLCKCELLDCGKVKAEGNRMGLVKMTHNFSDLPCFASSNLC